MNIERLTNIFNLIKEGLNYLLDRTALAIIGLLITLTLLLNIIFILNNYSFNIFYTLSLWLGGGIALFCFKYSFSLGFYMLGKSDLDLLTKPNSLVELYFGKGLIIALFVITLHIIGFFISFIFLGYYSVVHYLLGVSIVSFFLRLGAGIFAKGADISSSLVENEYRETIGIDDYRNVSSIADKIGDFFNNGLALKMDLIESLIGIMTAIVLYLSILFSQNQISTKIFIDALAYPLAIIIGSLIISFSTGFLILFFRRKSFLATSLKPFWVIYSSFVLTLISSFFITLKFKLIFINFESLWGLPTYLNPFIAITLGLILSLIIGIITDYYTSSSHLPVQEIVKFSEYSSTMTELNGTATGMRSLNIPILVAAIFTIVSYQIASFYGVMLMATGLLLMVPIILAASLYAPFIDNITGLIKMELGLNGDTNQDYTPQISEQYEHLNSIGNTLSALAKNYAANTVLLVVFSLFIAFIHIAGINQYDIAIFNPLMISLLFIGNLLPYFLSSILIRGVSFTTIEMLEEALLQLKSIPYLKESKAFPDLPSFINKSGSKIIKSIIIPCLLLIILPIIIGELWGAQILSILFIGIMISGVFLSISYTNTGAVLDNAKKLLEKGYYGGTDTQTYRNTVSGDLYGDSLKDLIGPSLNNLSKLIIIISITIIPIII